MNKNFKIGNREIGDDQPCFVIAEIGSNHNQDYELAIRMIDAAIDAGADAVKFQTFDAKTHVSSKAESPSYLEERDIQKLLKSLELNREWHAGLQAHTIKAGGVFFSSPCDREAVDGLEAIGCPAYKLASFDLPDLEFVSYLAKTGKPLILSTGLADWMDIQRAVDAAHATGNNQLALLQCTSLYPAPAYLSNLRAMPAMRQTFDVLTGYSDHTMGDNVTCASVAMGACIVEKHFTLDRSLPGPDHNFAMEPKEFQEMTVRIREIESAMGDGIKNGPRNEESEMALMARRSLHAARSIDAGMPISSEDLCVKRPGLGIAPHFQEHIIGRTAQRNIDADEWITWEMI